MKKNMLIAAALCFAGTAMAQNLVVVEGCAQYSFPASQAGVMNFADGKDLTVMGRTFTLVDGSRMYVSDRTVDDNTVEVVYNGTEVDVTVAGNIAQYISVSNDGAHLTIDQSSDVSEATCGEITYVLSGNSDAGSLLLNGSYKATIELRGLALTNPAGAAIDIQNGKRIEMSVKNGTVNTLVDGAAGSQKGCIYCKGHLELKGKGTLNVTGNKSHAIAAKEYVTMKNCTVNILGAAKDGINCNQYFTMESGTLSIAGTADDGIQCSFKDDVDREAEDTGTITIEGGAITATVTAKAVKALKADGDINVSGGELTLTATGGGIWDSAKAKTKAAACMGCDGDMHITGGTLTLKATGSGGKGMSCDGTLTVDGGTIDINTTGGLYAYVSGVEYDNYTGNVDRLNSDLKSSAKGIKADTDIVINGGTLTVSTTGYNAEGIESKGTLTINDGTLNVRAYDDAINSSSHMYINGGDITAIATNNDGIDSNGNIYLNGGVVRAFGAASPECGIDAAEEDGYTVIFKGGTLLAVGGGNSTPTKSESTQPYVSGSASPTAGSTIELRSGTTVLASFVIPDNYTATGGSTGGGTRPGGGSSSGSRTVLITCAGLTNGSSYTMACGTTTTTVSARLTGSGSGRPW